MILELMNQLYFLATNTAFSQSSSKHLLKNTKTTIKWQQVLWSYLVSAVGQNKDFAVSIFLSTKPPGVQ